MISYSRRGGVPVAKFVAPDTAEAEARQAPVLVPETAGKPRIRLGEMNDLTRKAGDSE